MKKLIASLLPCAALALASCGDSNYELHQTFFSPLKINGMDFLQISRATRFIALTRFMDTGLNGLMDARHANVHDHSAI